MKRRSPRIASIADPLSPLLWALWVLGWALGSAPHARGNAELDRQFALETVGYLKSWDNVDGLFSDYVSAAYKEYFQRQSRFVLQDLSKADAVLTRAKLPYHKLIEDADIVGQLARSLRAESVIRTKIQKEGPSYRFTLDWLHAPKMELLATETFTMAGPGGGKSFGSSDVKTALEGALDRLIAKVPFQGHVTGRDNNSVTINIGQNMKLKKGDQIVISTLDEVKKHPLLKTVVDWRLNQTGKLEVESVDEGMAFCRVIDEETSRPVARYQKISRIIPVEIPQAPMVTHEKQEKIDRLSEPPQLGWASGALWTGSFNRQYSHAPDASGNSVVRTGGGFFTGAKVDSQIWLNREFFGEIGLGFGFSNYTQQLAGAPGAANTPDGDAKTGSLSAVLMKIAAGYTYYTSGDLLGPKAWAKVGYHSYSYTLPDAERAFVGSTTIKGFFLGVGGDLPIREKFGGVFMFDFGVLTSPQETNPFSGAIAGATDVGFYVGGYYRYKPRLVIRAGLDVAVQGVDFASGNSLSHKVISLGPSLLYYF